MADTRWSDVADLPAGEDLEAADTLLVRRPGPENNGRGKVYEVTLQDLLDVLAAAQARA